MKLSYLYLFFILCLTISTASSQSSREINKIIPLKSDGRLVIDTYKGSITITTHDKPQVEVYVKIESDDSDYRDASQDVEDTEIQIGGTENEVTLRTDYTNVRHNHHRHFWDWLSDAFESSYSLPLVHYTIKMPSTAGLRIKDYKSRTRIDNIKTEVKLNTYKGEVEIDNLLGGIDLETYKGEIRVSFTKINNDSRFETVQGKYHCGSAKGEQF